MLEDINNSKAAGYNVIQLLRNFDQDPVNWLEYLAYDTDLQVSSSQETQQSIGNQYITSLQLQCATKHCISFTYLYSVLIHL